MEREIKIGLTPKEAAMIEIALNKQKEAFKKYLTLPYGTEKDFAQDQIVAINAIIKKLNLE